VENIHVVKGSAVLTGAAIAAVSKWRYAPFLLNGEPVAVQTNIQLQFRLPQ